MPCRALDSPASSQDDDEALPASLAAALGQRRAQRTPAGSSEEGGSDGELGRDGNGGLDLPPEELPAEAALQYEEREGEEDEGDEAEEEEFGEEDDGQVCDWLTLTVGCDQSLTQLCTERDVGDALTAGFQSCLVCLPSLSAYDMLTTAGFLCSAGLRCS